MPPAKPGANSMVEIDFRDGQYLVFVSAETKRARLIHMGCRKRYVLQMDIDKNVVDLREIP